MGRPGVYCRGGMWRSTWAGKASLGKECCSRWMGRYVGEQRTLRAWVTVSVVVLKKGARTGWALLW